MSFEKVHEGLSASTVVGDSVFWINDVAIFTDDDSTEWELRRTMNGNDVSVDIYENGVLSSSLAATYVSGELVHLILASPATSDWVALDDEGRIYDGSLTFEPHCDGSTEPGGPGGGDEGGEPGEGDICDQQNFLGDGDPCEDELDDANEAIGDAFVVLALSVTVTKLTAGAFFKPAVFATGLAGVRAGVRIAQYAYCRANQQNLASNSPQDPYMIPGCGEDRYVSAYI